MYASTDEVSSGKILSFNTKLMYKCRKTLRIQKVNKLKFGQVILLDCLPLTSEYRLYCYGKTCKKWLNIYHNNLKIRLLALPVG